MSLDFDIITSQPVTRSLVTPSPVTKVLDFGQHAYADTFIAPDQLHLSEPVFPLQVNLCPHSGLLQLGYVSNAKARYNLYNYSYTSSNSETSRRHWDTYADDILKKYSIQGLVVEIGCNDGYLIRQFQQPGVNTLGVDSSEEMCEIARGYGVDTLHALFDSKLAEKIRQQHGPARLICANNVFNHANDPVEFARGVASLLDTNGVFVFEVPYWLSMIESGRFTDMVYHEHPTYFTIKSAWNILKVAGLEIVDHEVVNYHGGSLRVFAQKINSESLPKNIEQAVSEETRAGLYDLNFYKDLQRKFEQQRNQWLLNFYQLRSQDPDAIFIGVGAAAKANTWLTWHGLNKTHLNWVTDSSIYKHGKYTPLSRIPITDDTVFANHSRPYALILSWNIGSALKDAILNINPNTRFLSQ